MVNILQFSFSLSYTGPKILLYAFLSKIEDGGKSEYSIIGNFSLQTSEGDTTAVGAGLGFDHSSLVY